MFLIECIGSGPWLSGCGNVCIPADLAKLTTLIYNAIKVIVPITLIFIGMFDMAKAITSKSEDEIKKAQQLLVKKAVMGALVFVLFSAIILLLSILDDASGNGNGERNAVSCMMALFDYSDDTTAQEDGASSGYLDPINICKTNGYKNALRIYVENGSASGSYIPGFYVCVDYEYSNIKCNDGSRLVDGEKYTFSNGRAYCVAPISTGDTNGKIAIIQGWYNDSDSYERGTPTYSDIYACDRKSTQASCQQCCRGQSYKSGYLLAVSESFVSNCLCVGKLG